MTTRDSFVFRINGVKIWEIIFILHNKNMSCDTLFLKFYLVNITTKTYDPY